jgi:hypothetical protein
MAMRASDLVEPRHIERLRAEVVETISAGVAYPPFFDFRTGKLRSRPIDRAKVAEIEQFIGSANFAPIERSSPSSPDTRHFIERLILRYLEVNSSLAGARSARYLPLMRSQALRLAAETHRRFVGHLNGSERDFGSRRQAASWASTRRSGRHGASDTAHSARLLEAALQQRKPGRAPSSPALKSAPDGVTVPAPAVGGIQSQPGASPFGAFSPDARGGPIRYPAQPRDLTNQPTGPLASVGASPPSAGGGRGPMRELPPDLLNLYGDYLGDLDPEARAPGHAAPPQLPPMQPPIPSPRAAPPQPIVPPAPTPPPLSAIAPTDARGDQLIFWQLRYQLEAYVRLAARSYGLPGHGGDPASVLDELRRSGFVDEADLRIAEGVFALTDRVTAQGHATTADYRQALMLYLLYHRSHVNA